MRALAMDSRLEAIAGRPAGMLVGPGSVALSGFGPFDPRTLYAVIDCSTPFPDWASIAQIRNGNTSRVFLQADGTTGTRLAATMHYTNGNQGGSTFVPISSGRNVVSVVVDSDGLVTISVLGGETASRAYVVGDGLTGAQSLVLSASVEYLGNLLAVAYPAAHTLYQRTMIMNKLLQMSGGGGSSSIRAPRRADYELVA